MTTIDLTQYNTLVDDDGSNTVGTLWTKAKVASVILTPAQTAVTALDAVDATKAPLASPAFTGVPTAPTAALATNTTQLATTAFVLANAAAGTVDVGTCEGRLTLTTLTPVPTADVTGATNVYWTPYKGKYIALYDGTSAWVLRAFAETTLALGTVTSGLPYDVFAYDNAGTLALEKLAWTNGTTRATALVLQDGVLVKTGATTRRYLGTFYTTSTTTTEDSAVKRYLWNFYNRVHLPLQRYESTASWSYGTATVRQANANAANQVEVIIGVAGALLDLSLHGVIAIVSVIPNYFAVGIGEDSTSAFTVIADAVALSTSNQTSAPSVRLVKRPAAGRHFYSWNENVNGSASTTFYAGNNGGSLGTATVGLSGQVEG